MPEHDQESLERWLAERHRDLLDGLPQFLEPAAGLREATTLQAEHAEVLSALDSHLDTQAGLASILRTSATAAAPVRSDADSPASPDTVAAIMTADPSVRVALRRHPIITTVILGDLTVQALKIVNVIQATGDLERARTLGRALARDLNLACDLNLPFVRSIHPARATDLGLASAQDLAGHLARDLDLVYAVVRAHDLGRVLDRDRDLARDLARDLNSDLNRTLDLVRARYIARKTARLVSDALGIGQVERLVAALLDGALDDFTRADLTNIDLGGLDLTGIRWSDHGTTWPPGTNVNALRTRSQEVARGIYVITSPDGNDKAREFEPV
jgi:hypothetical protein